MMYTTVELKDAATAMAEAYEKMLEIGEGVGGLGIKHPEFLEDFQRWDNMSENKHADTVLTLIAAIHRQKAINRLQNRYILEMGDMFDD